MTEELPPKITSKNEVQKSEGIPTTLKLVCSFSSENKPSVSKVVPFSKENLPSTSGVVPFSSENVQSRIEMKVLDVNISTMDKVNYFPDFSNT